MAQVNRIPLGYLDLINAQTGGRNPKDTGEGLQPIIDLTPLYQSQEMGGFNFTLSHDGNNQVLDILVPTNELWLVWSVGTRTALQLTEFEQWEWAYVQLPRTSEGSQIAPFPPFHVSPLLSVTVAGQAGVDAFSLPRPIPLGPGTGLRAVIRQRDAGVARVTRLQGSLTVFRI